MVSGTAKAADPLGPVAFRGASEDQACSSSSEVGSMPGVFITFRKVFVSSFCFVVECIILLGRLLPGESMFLNVIYSHSIYLKKKKVTMCLTHESLISVSVLYPMEEMTVTCLSLFKNYSPLAKSTV